MPEQRDRLQREIDEILDKVEQFPSASERRARARRKTAGRMTDSMARRRNAVLAGLSRVSMSEVMLLSFVLILASMFLRRFNPLLTQWVLYAGIVLFISSFAMLMFGRRSSSTSAGYWRGRQIEYRQSGLGDRVRRWFASVNRKR